MVTAVSSFVAAVSGPGEGASLMAETVIVTVPVSVPALPSSRV